MTFTLLGGDFIQSKSCFVVQVCPGKDGPIFFGNDQQGHVLSYTFHINDSQARGFSKRYSILVVMMDKIYLLNSWPFLVPHLKTVIEHITKKANVVYEREKAKHPQQPPQASRWSKPARSLKDLTDDRNIFKILHLSFVWILKACGNRITETLLEGPPIEDSIIDMEKQEGRVNNSVTRSVMEVNNEKLKNLDGYILI